MQICTSPQKDYKASIPSLSFLQAWCPSYRPTNSVKALKKIIVDTHTQSLYCSSGICSGLLGWAGTRKVQEAQLLLRMADCTGPVVKLSYLWELVLQPSWELDNCPDWVKLIVHWFTAYCSSTLYRAMLAVINNACLLTCDTSRTISDQHPQFICSHMDAGYYSYGRRLSRYIMQTNKHLQFIKWTLHLRRVYHNTIVQFDSF